MNKETFNSMYDLREKLDPKPDAFRVAKRILDGAGEHPNRDLCSQNFLDMTASIKVPEAAEFLKMCEEHKVDLLVPKVDGDSELNTITSVVGLDDDTGVWHAIVLVHPNIWSDTALVSGTPEAVKDVISLSCKRSVEVAVGMVHHREK